MSRPSPVLAFKHTWRSYQKEILDELDTHLSDKKINVVAAPGAGKTTLGIELISRLESPALILAPTITIRNQWKERIASAFLENPHDADSVVSLDIRNPKYITSITYQALLAAFCGETDSNPDDEETDISEDGETAAPPKKLFSRFSESKADEIIKKLRDCGVSVLCLDEAHHLRKEWWRALDYLAGRLKEKHLVSLTATPPYDVELEEWNRYEELCGPIDALISIPELVKNGDLAPHQDFVHISRLRDFEDEEFAQLKARFTELMKSISENADFAKMLSETKFFQSPKDYLKEILEDTPFFMSIASLIKANGITPSKFFLSLYGISAGQIPPPSPSNVECLLDGLVFKYRGMFGEIEGEIQRLEASARAQGFIEGRGVKIQSSPKIRRALATSLGKLDSIKRIVALEHNALRGNLRMVILADYIREKALNSQIEDIGAVPIFETLRKDFDENLKPGLLTGRLAIIPATAARRFRHMAEDCRMAPDAVKIDPLPFDPRYAKVSAKHSARHLVVSIVTRLFGEGEIRVLSGTQALLGEGWDAPCINALILSSTVSSYMLSNQMRGRAIRTEKGNPQKVSNIWHLCTVKRWNSKDLFHSLRTDGESTADDIDESFDFDHDIRSISRRFEGFEAPAVYEPHIIESNIDRLALDIPNLTGKDIDGANKTMETLAADRRKTAKMWELGLDEPFGAPKKNLKSQAFLPKMKNYLYLWMNPIIMLFFYFMVAFYSAFIPQAVFRFNSVWPTAILMFSIFFLLSARSIWRALACASPNGHIKQIARAVYETLYAHGIVKTHPKMLRFDISHSMELNPMTEDDEVAFVVYNLSPKETDIIISAVREIVDPIENPRYILERKKHLYNFIQKDYHSVPAIISEDKKRRELFAELWEQYVGPCSLIYTRTHTGRLFLLKARKRAFSGYYRKSHVKNKWA